MKESYEEDLANHFGLDPYADVGNNVGVASVKAALSRCPFYVINSRLVWE